MQRRRQQDSQKLDVIVFDSSFIPDQSRKDFSRNSVFVSFFMLMALVNILTGSFVSAFRVQTDWFLLLPALALMCAGFIWFILEERLEGYLKLLAAMLLIVLYGAVCFVLQVRIENGFYRTANAVIRTINQVYEGNIEMFSSGAAGDETVFLLAVLFPITALLAAGIVRKRRFLLVLAIMFPVAALTFVAGGCPADVWLFLFLLGLVVILAASLSCLPGWRAAVFAGVLALGASIPAWYLMRPLMGLPVSEAAKAGTKLETRLMQSLWQLLPQISGGKLNLSLEGVGGGVEDGTLGAVDGYYFTGVEALRVTSEQKPQETVYLRGYIGEEYTGQSYELGNAENFENAAASWRTEGDASLYIENLPFLRMMYYENFREEDAEKAEDELKTTANTIIVENLNANPKYTYVPYLAFLNDNYQVYGGDGYVGGQTVQEDIFSCYWRSSYQEAMEAIRGGEAAEGVLDQVEASYQSYCKQQDMQVPQEGLERLSEECAATAEKEKWNQPSNGVVRPAWAVADEIEEIRLHVIKTLLTACKYEMDVDALPEGKDFIEYFLYDTKEGYSMHFAAAATMMFRMYGVPARYVVGYVAPKELFSHNDDGTYTAVLKDGNAHAWTEIYQPFLGWTPVEVTPGIEAEVIEDEEAAEDGAQAAPQAEAESEAASDSETGAHFRFKLPKWLTGNLDSVMLAVQVLFVLGIITVFTKKILIQRKIRLGLGEDPTGRVQALYHSIYQLLVLAGMPEAYTAADGQVMEYLGQVCPAFSEDDAIRLKNTVLMANYGYQEQTASDVWWMLQVYKQTGKAIRRKTGIRKRIKYFVLGE